MQLKRLFIISALTAAVISSVSCQRDEQPSDHTFYGQWKTSYGDTIIFSKENGKNILTFNMSMNANPSADTKREFIYAGNKLGILDGLNGNDFRMLQTFKWKEEGRSFEVQGVEWFMFMSSTTTYFTFTKI